MAPLPLDGIRIADFTWIIAGPYGAYLLARMGAEVIHVEGLAPPDHIRENPPHADGIAGLNRSGFFNSINAGKKSVTLNLRQQEHLEIAKQIIAKSDAVIESYSPGTMAKLGLGYDELRRFKDDVILVSCSGFGQSGPDSRLRAYMGTVHAYAGINSINGHAGGPPRPLGGTWADYITGSALVFAVLGALHYRERTGRGQWIDLSMAEAAMSLMGAAFADYFVNGRIAGTVGNASTTAAPNNVYPCKGEDSWVAISIESDAQWDALVRVIGDERLTDRSYRGVIERRRDASKIDERIGAWTSQRTAWDAASALATAGVPAAPTCGTVELLEQPQLLARGFFVEPDHSEVGKRAIPNLPWKISTTPDPPCAPAPLLGEHNEYILGEILRLPREMIDKLNATVGDAMRGRRWGTDMDFETSYAPEQERDREEFRSEVRAWIEEHAGQIVLPVDPEDLSVEQFECNRAFLRALGERGWYAPTWPRDYGGGSMAPHVASVIREELERAIPHIENLHPPGDIGGSTAGALWEVGTDEQKASFLPPVLRGDVITWELYTEPEAGSDLPALSSRAERDGDQYVISGTKTLVGGHFEADWLFYLAITDPHAARRENLSAFLVPADSPGITMTDLDMIAGSKKRTMIFDGVRVPETHMIGREGDGWRAFSSGLFGALTVGIGPYMDRDMRAYGKLLDYCRAGDGERMRDPVARDALARTYVDAQVQRLLRLRNDWLVESGQTITYEGSQVSLGRKTFDLALGEALHQVLGPAAMLRGDEAPLDGQLEYFHRYAILMAHPGGTVEIQKLRMFRGMEAASPA